MRSRIGTIPPPLPCNGSTTSPDTASTTAFASSGALVLRLTGAIDACAEVNAGTGGDFLEITLDGAASACAACVTTACDTAIYSGSAVHLERVHDGTRTSIDQRCYVVVTCTASYVRASVFLADTGDGGMGEHFFVVTPMCRPSNDCTNP